jgi:signal transduction histidine kinase
LLKFSPDGGTIHVEATLPDGFVEVAVCDSAADVPKEQREEAFDRNQRALVERLGGRIWMDAPNPAG